MASLTVLWLSGVLLAAISCPAHAANETFAAGMVSDPSFSPWNAYINASLNASNIGYVNTTVVDVHMALGSNEEEAEFFGPDPAVATDPYAYAWRTELATVPSSSDANVSQATMLHHLVYSEASVQRMLANNRSIEVFHLSYAAPNLSIWIDDFWNCYNVLGGPCLYNVTHTLLAFQERDNRSVTIDQYPISGDCHPMLRQVWSQSASTVDVSTLFTHAPYNNVSAYAGEYVEFIPPQAGAKDNFEKRAAMFYTTMGPAPSNNFSDFNVLWNRTIILGVTEYNVNQPGANDSWTTITCHRVGGDPMKIVNATATAATAAAAAVRPALMSVVALTLLAIAVLCY